MKVSTLDKRFLNHSGPALIFDDYPSMKLTINDEYADITANTVLILKNFGPKGGLGMPEWGILLTPKKKL